jgi:hypothetical protein
LELRLAPHRAWTEGRVALEVQVCYAKGDPWDGHSDIQQHRKNAKGSDQPFAAVIKNLKSRGLSDDPIVVCGSEFGRTPVV